ncbi:Predicted pyrophosphatase or phosphodiesterase, AlkP superfamily [Chitinophaga costaii]|uniref:Predicted pyrophosphatase or phosphodiesterase, AlkP superfamily n=1 Tax=Chitinophaga costaii TaxID=1335309 RepID=A0A1C4BGU3_9BACT|nr:nucleotide pyrophosphatase/phosphodiesterase family protein [Chitinophaga costaii]PUZ27619.1 alkaline phosphatase family protein [Chitinophaga costaii]SCC05954.1 Predicted pyrophosphatase or phosphodiesterase, AlkP superfamily [Chitinophaga costaii]
MKKTVVIDVVGLSAGLIGTYTPFLEKYARRRQVSQIQPMLPAVTTAVQSTYLTGQWPGEHGIVGNGWYDRSDSEIKFWKQSNKLVEAEKIWHRARRADPSFTVSKMFWWYNMYADVDFSVTPRPQYLSDGRKMPDCYSHPADLRDRLQEQLGTFPLFQFWGPGANIKSTQWIADASILTDQWHDPTLTLIYLPHLDYCLQKFGHDMSRVGPELQAVDKVCEQLITYYENKGAEIIVLSEYGITPVHHPIHLNRLLRDAGLLSLRVERGTELLDAGASKAFAVADHQVAHIYLNHPSYYRKVRTMLETTPGIAQVLDRAGKQQHHLYHDRAGDLIAVADKDSWFSYYYWQDDAKAPDFARIVDIHRKPGYDPVEMFLNPADPFVKLKVVGKLIKKKLGFRYLMNVIPLDATLIKGSHGRLTEDPAWQPILITGKPQATAIPATQVYDLIWQHLVRE